MDDKNRLNDGEKPQTPADREAKAKRRILVGIAAGALLVAGLIIGGIYLSGRQGGTPTAPGSGTPTSQQEQVDGEKPCEHDWTVTYKTVHHDAVTHTENVTGLRGQDQLPHRVQRLPADHRRHRRRAYQGHRSLRVLHQRAHHRRGAGERGLHTRGHRFPGLR